jgi:hypothetical protein
MLAGSRELERKANESELFLIDKSEIKAFVVFHAR